MTGFRVALGGAQQVLGITPDMTVLGKVIGGGMPLAAFGASKQVMSKLSPLGPVYQAGTLSGNPIATACGLATLKEIQKPGFYEALGASTRALMQGMGEAAKAAGVPYCADSEGGMFGFFLQPQLAQNYQQAVKTDSALFAKFYHGMLDHGIYFAPALYEAGFVSSAHTQADLDETFAAAKEVFSTLL
jgi:glutamate-1-semialdehyde 2,1-aminomutase